MRIETQIKMVNSRCSQIQHLYRKACAEFWTQERISKLYFSVSLPADVAQLRQQYVAGYRQALHDQITREKVIHGHIIEGKFYSVDSSRPDYYGHTWTPSEFCAFNLRGGMYWRESVEQGAPLPFFVSSEVPT